VDKKQTNDYETEEKITSKNEISNGNAVLEHDSNFFSQVLRAPAELLRSRKQKTDEEYAFWGSRRLFQIYPVLFPNEDRGQPPPGGH
jgi:hypothetical protein